MKKVVCVVMCIVFCWMIFVPFVFAEDSTEFADSPKTDEYIGAVSFSCTYDSEKSQVLIAGTVSHDFMISHPDYEIHIYSAVPSKDIQEAITASDVLPLAKSSMSVRFTFYVEVENIIDRYSNYAVVLSSPEGQNFLAARPLMPAVNSTYEYDKEDRTHFKGLNTDSGNSIVDEGIGTAIIDIDLNLLEGDAADSIIYTVKNTSFNIRKSYVDKLDRSILAASLNNCNVYLRFLYHPNEETSKYGIPSVYSENALEYVCNISEFLVNRYSQGNGRIAGIIIGSCADDVETLNDIGGLAAENYCEQYSFYTAVIANAVRQINSNVDIVISVSDRNDYSYEGYKDNKLNPSAFLDRVADFLDSSFSQKFSYSVIIESNASPLGIDGEKIINGIDTKNTDNTVIGAYNISVFCEFLDELRTKYESAPSSVTYMWHASSSLDGAALSCAYVYSYLKLLQNKEISSFVLDVSDSQYKEISALLSVIDTPMANTQTEYLLKYFKATSWEKIIGDNVTFPSFCRLWTKAFAEQSLQPTKGSFTYMDFSVASDFNSMRAGENCTTILSDQDTDEIRALRAISAPLKRGDTVQIIGSLQYPESYAYTSVISITVEANDLSASENALYEIALTVGNNKNRIVAKGILKNGVRTELYFDVSEYAAENLANYLTFSVKSVTEDSDSLSVWIHDVKGYSSEYSSDELRVLVENERNEIRNFADTDAVGFNYKIVIIIVAVTFAAFSLGIGLMILFRRDDTSKRE